MRYWILSLLVLISTLSVQAFPVFFKKLTEDPRVKAEFKQDCSTCHLLPGGGGERNEFGKAYALEGADITKELIKKFPEHFDTTQ